MFGFSSLIGDAMPFFTIKSSRFVQPLPMPLERVEETCRKLNLEDLLSLKRRIFNFFKAEDARRVKLKTAMTDINQYVTELETQIKANKDSIERAISYNNEIKANLPGNGAERWLALQALAQIPDAKYELDTEVVKLRKLKEQFAKDLAWINKEFSACADELKIVDQIINEKTPQEAPTPSADNTMKM